MEFDTSWGALIKPGAATTFFSPAPLERPVLSVDYSGATAWWLAELSRLAYRPNGRDALLLGAGFRELQAFQSRGIQAILVAAADSAEASAHILVFRGTDSPRDWLWNLNVSRDRARTGGEVHRGFNRALDQIWSRIESVLAQLSGPIAYTGHSLGGALAVLAAARRPPRAVYTFGAPRLGDRAFADGLDGLSIFQLVNNDDLVTRMPPNLRQRPFLHIGDLFRIVSEPRGATHGKFPAREYTELATPFDVRPGLFGPPRVLCDHSPVNYVAHLERLQPAASPPAPA